MHDSAQIASMIQVCNAVDLGIEEASHNGTTYILHPKPKNIIVCFFHTVWLPILGTARCCSVMACFDGGSHVIKMADNSNCTQAETPVDVVVTIVSVYTVVAVSDTIKQCAD